MRAAAIAQGAYYVVTGLAPLISMDAFEAVTGDKTDEWLVVMVALLTVVIGATLLAGARRGRASDLALLGAGSALSFGALDIWVTATGTGTIAYLADLGVEALFLGLWSAGVWRHGSQERKQASTSRWQVRR